MLPRPCLTCGTLQTDGARCTQHRSHNFNHRASTNPAYRDPTYRRNRRLLMTAHLLQHGELCPGAPDLKHNAHPCPARDLTVDHITPLAEGGTHDPTNLRVLCRTANARAGARLGRGKQT